MATEIPQRALRNETAALLRRVEAGEHLRITVHGHPVADLVPVVRPVDFVPFDEIARGLRGLMDADDRLDAQLRAVGDEPVDPFA